MTEPCLLPAGQAARAIADRRLSARSLVESCLARIERLDPVIGAWVAVDADRARAAADRADAEIAAGRRRGPLHGMPYGLKDILRTAELPTRAASRLPLPEDGEEAAVHCRLRDAGAILIGKLNTYEFGTGNGAVYDDLPAPTARNPWSPDHFTGGSSTGAGAAVASGMVPLAIGTDTGGSVRLPAAACGLVGLKPTYDLIPRTGMLPNCPSQDHLGPLTRTVADAALALAAVTGSDPAIGEGSLNGLRVAVVRSFHDGDPVADPAVADGFERAVGFLRESGAETVDRRVGPSLRDFRACGRIVNAGESFAIHRRWLADASATIGTALRDKLEAAAGLTAADYLDAQRWRRALDAALVEAMAGCDLMLCAGTMTSAPRLDDEAGCIRFTGDSAMTPFSLSGQPALVLPTGLDPTGLPIGVQLAARPFQEAVLLRAGAALEKAIGFAGTVPSESARAAADCARPPVAPERDDGRAGRLARSMADSVARIPRPLPDDLGSALSFQPTEFWS